MNPLQLRTFFGQVFEQSRAIHHVTTSFAVHKATDTFYSEWAELTDTFIETYQGKYGRIQGMYEMEVDTNVDINVFIAATANTLRMDVYPGIATTDPDLQNICADMIELCDHTNYLLTLS